VTTAPDRRSVSAEEATRLQEGPVMFAQVIRGQVSDPARMREALDSWVRDLAPGAEGWLGSTSGVTADGRGVTVARFESEEAARRNSERPEQDKWWSETSQLFDGDVTFADSSDVDVDLAGNPDDAGFVQVMQGRGTDSERARELMKEHAPEWAAFRPDILGSMSIAHDEGKYTMVMYFTSEADAREGEAKLPPAELQAQMEEMGSLSVGEPEFIDLTDPWIVSPG
jgi:hypothetical protein